MVLGKHGESATDATLSLGTFSRDHLECLEFQHNLFLGGCWHSENQDHPSWFLVEESGWVDLYQHQHFLKQNFYETSIKAMMLTPELLVVVYLAS